MPDPHPGIIKAKNRSPVVARHYIYLFSPKLQLLTSLNVFRHLKIQ